MRFNSARPIRALTAKEQDGLREVLFPAEQPKVFAGSETDDRPDPYRDSESPEKRKLYPRELDVADPFVGDMIDLEEVRISDKSLVGRILGANRVAMTIENTIYGKNMTDPTFIHELVHVWQYKNELIAPVRAGLIQLAVTAIGQRDELYEYNVEPRRKSFRDYGFEEQASIIQDAFLVLVKEKPPLRNKDYESGTPVSEDTELLDLYELFMEEFREWHEELQPSSSSSTPSTEEEN